MKIAEAGWPLRVMSIKRGIFFTFLTQFPVLLLQIVSGIFLTRMLGVSGKGVFAVFQADIALFVLFAGLNFATGAIHFISRKTFTPGKTLGIGLLLTLSGTLLTYIILKFLTASQSGLLMPDGYHSNFYVIYLTATVALSLLISSFSAIFQGLKNFRVVNRITIFNAIINAGTYAIVFFTEVHQNNFEKILLINLTLTFVNALLWLAVILKEVPVSDWSFSLRGTSGFFSFVGLTYLSTAINFFNYRLDIWILEHYHNHSQVGQYSLAINLAQMLWLISQPVTLVLQPYLSGADNRENRTHFRHYSRLITFALSFLALVGFFIAPLLIPVLYGADFEPSVESFRILLPGALLAGLTQIFALIAITRHKPQYNLMASLAGLVVTVILDLILIPDMGSTGAAIASTASFVVVFSFVMYFSFFRLGMPGANYFLIRKEDIQRIFNG